MRTGKLPFSNLNETTKQHQHPYVHWDCISGLMPEMYIVLTAPLHKPVLGLAHSRAVNAENNIENSPEAKVSG